MVEVGGTDTDGDGYFDDQTDSDSDGLADDVDGDVGNDGTAENSTQALFLTGSDSDGDGEPNSVVSADLDSDGVPGQYDIDSDDDGITDVIEAGGTDGNSDGRHDGSSTDTDSDGFGDDVDGDVGNDGTAENTAGALLVTGTDSDNDGAPNSYPNADNDSDDIPDLWDIDSDNDGIVDNNEGIATSAYVVPSNADTDGDGLDNSYDPDNGGTYVIPEDTDGDSSPDYLDLDSDDDTFTDLIEGHDSDGNRVADSGSPASSGVSGGTTDSDNDGLYDGWDNNTSSFDATNSGLTPTSYPDVNQVGGDRDWREAQDTDQDGVPDHLDIDEDNDGIPDITESDGNEPDSDEDGDGILNWFDTTDNGNGGDGSTTSYVDGNGDGIPDVYDWDRDGVPNHFDKDSDNDGIVDIIEAGGTDNDNDGEVDYPTPGDASSMVDADNDGLADALDDVNSGSGSGEVTSGTPHPLTDTDSNGDPNYLDIDSDDDGIIDNIEGQATTATPLQATTTDTDGDGISDVFDPDNGGTYIVPEDTDSDTDADYVDSDSDGDGESDLIEGWDTDGNGSANTTPTGSDSDNDGLDNAFDDIVGPNATTNPSNDAQTAMDFPNTDDGLAERDWREIPCGGGSVVLAPSNQLHNMATYCQQDPWTYYFNPSDPTDLLFAVEHKPGGAGSNTNDFIATASLRVSVNPQSEAGTYSAIDLPNQDATFVMGRYWNVNVTTGSLNGFVNVRFFFDPAERDTLQDVAQRWNLQNAGSTPFVSGLRWFIVNAGSFAHNSADLQPLGIQLSSQITPEDSGTVDGIDYMEFQFTSLTGGGLAYTVGSNSVILPVDLLSFDAKARSNNTVEVVWTTASEINSDRFEIERSSDGENWKYIGQVPAAGNSNREIDYSYFDTEPLSGISYYRLVQVDLNGDVDVSETRMVRFDEMLAEEMILVYPNPSSGSFTVEMIVLENNQGKLLLVNPLGQTIRNWSFGATELGHQSINVEGLSAGSYLVLWERPTGLSSVKLIVK